MTPKTPILPAKFTMEFEPATIEHLGLRLYSSLPPVIGELVSNAWDADAPSVAITLPVGPINDSSVVVVKDTGNGMSITEMQEKFLLIGRNRRDTEKCDTSKKKKRPVTGRKGLGKLSVFGIARQVEIQTVSNGFALTLLLDFEKMKSWTTKSAYEPEILRQKCGITQNQDGTTITIRSLYRKKAIDIEQVRTQLARRFRFIGSGFKVSINGQNLQPTNRRNPKDCRVSWEVKQLNVGEVVDANEGWTVSGWIGITHKSSQTDRGVDIFARGKAVELDTMFNLKTTHAQFARAYVVGEIHAEFLDAEEDRISTARNSVFWETEAGQQLQAWGAVALTDVFERWLKMQRQEKEETVVKTGNFDEWLKTRIPREQKVARRLLKVIIDDDNIDAETAEPLLEIIKANVEFQAFQDLVDEIEDSGTNITTLLKLFKDWRIIEAREQLKLSDGRLEAIERLSEYLETGALEVSQVQPLFEENTWLIDPSWETFSGQTRYTTLLRKQFPDPPKIADKDRRLDLLGVKVSSEIHIVELKRPETTLTRDNLEQIERYVDWARSNLVGTSDDGPRSVRGRLIVGHMGNSGELKEKLARLAGDDIRVETFGDLQVRARRMYGDVQTRLKDVAPEYSRESRHARRSKPAKKTAKKK